MKKGIKEKQQQIEINILRQYIQLLAGPAGIDKVNKQIAQSQTDKALEIADANEFDNYIKEIADLR